MIRLCLSIGGTVFRLLRDIFPAGQETLCFSWYNRLEGRPVCYSLSLSQGLCRIAYRGIDID